MRNKKTHDIIGNDPVLSFDNQSSSSESVVELLTVAEAAAALTISQTGIRRLQHSRQLPFIKVGNSVRFARRDLVAYLERHRVGELDATKL